jgi:hypothetical protein
MLAIDLRRVRGRGELLRGRTLVAPVDGYRPATALVVRRSRAHHSEQLAARST